MADGQRVCMRCQKPIRWWHQYALAWRQRPRYKGPHDDIGKGSLGLAHAVCEDAYQDGFEAGWDRHAEEARS